MNEISLRACLNLWELQYQLLQSRLMVLHLYIDESQIYTSNLELELQSELQTCLLSNCLCEIST